MLGFGGHFATKSRAYSTTFGALRAARSTAMRRANTATAAHPEQLAPVDHEDQVLIVGAWTYAGTGWRTTADAALALAAADATRSRRPAAVAA
jgi:Replication initiator protein, pSAM2